MNRETIEKAARKYATDKYGGEYTKQWAIAQIHSGRDGFIDGAQWRINAAWHDTTEIPEPGKDCLVELKDGDGNVCMRIDWRSEYEWVNACHYDKILQWAYIDDLLPDGKE